MARASGTQEEQRSRIIRPADAQMFVLVAARVETDYGLGEGRARQGRDICGQPMRGDRGFNGIGLMPMSTTCQNADRASHVSRATWPRPALGADPTS